MVLVTGASGLLGQALIRKLLLEGVPVRLLLRDIDSLGFESLSVERCQGNVLDPETLHKAMVGVETVYHTAMLPTNLPGMFDELFNVNVIGTRNVIDSCKMMGVKNLVYVSNYSALISKKHKHVTISEKTPFDTSGGISSYSKTMAMACLEVEEAHSNELSTLIVLPSYQMGPFDYKLSLIGHFMWDFARGRVPFLAEGGFEISDSRDVATVAVSLASKQAWGERFLYSNGFLRVRDFMHWLEALSGIDAPKTYLSHSILLPAAWFLEYRYKARGEYPIFNRSMLDMLKNQVHCDTSKVTNLLNFTKRTWETTFADTYKWLADHYHLVQVKSNQSQ